MKITPLEIRQKTFEKGFRGYGIDEVSAYLQSLSQEWERLLDENKDMNNKIESLQKEVDKLREVENSLFKTLKTAEDTGANLVDHAKKTAELHMREPEMNAEAMLSDAKTKARNTIEESETIAKQTIDEMEAQLKNLMHSYKTLENFREDVISDIKALASDALERVDRLKGQVKRLDIEGRFFTARQQGKKFVDDTRDENKKNSNKELKVSVTNKGIVSEPEQGEPAGEESAVVENTVVPEETSPQNEEVKKEEIPIEEKSEPSKKEKSSFFDEIE